MEEKWLLKIAYSWGDEESDLEFTSFEDAWTEAKLMALREIETCNVEHDLEMGLFIDKENAKVTLHYTYDDEYCYYNVVKW